MVIRFIIANIVIGILTLLVCLISKPLTRRYGYGWRKVVWVAVVIFGFISFKNDYIANKMSEYSVVKKSFYEDIENPADLETSTIEAGFNETSDKDVLSDGRENIAQGNIGLVNISETEAYDIGKTDFAKSGINAGCILKYVFLAVWIAGMVFFAARYLLQYKRLKDFLAVSGVEEDSELCYITEILGDELNIKNKVETAYVHGLLSPIQQGIFKPHIYIPYQKEIDIEELSGILCHELYHCKAHDMAYKLFFIVVGIINWFNPFVHMIRRMAYDDMELVCDARVVYGRDKEQISQYCNSILKFVPSKCELVTSFGSRTKKLKSRFDNCFRANHFRRGYILPAIVFFGIAFFAMFFTSCGYGIFGPSYAKDMDGLIKRGDGYNLTRSYNTFRDERPEFAYDAEDWLDEEGKLSIPFDTLPKDIKSASSAFFIPYEVLDDLSTEELLSVVFVWMQMSLTRTDAYSPSKMLEILCDRCQPFDELFHRADAYRVIYADYMSQTLNEDDFKYITVLEVLLAQDEVFNKLSDTERENVTEKAFYFSQLRKESAGIDGKNYAPFFGAALELLSYPEKSACVSYNYLVKYHDGIGLTKDRTYYMQHDTYYKYIYNYYKGYSPEWEEEYDNIAKFRAGNNDGYMGI